MPDVRLRKKLIAVEEIFHEGGPVSRVPLRRAAALAVIHNPFAGVYVEEIAEFMDDLKPLGLDLANSLVSALGGNIKSVEGYGKGAIVGSSGGTGNAARCARHPHQCVLRAKPFRCHGSRPGRCSAGR